MATPRVDEALVARGLAGSLEQARLMVMEGRVYLGAGKVANASQKAKDGLALTVRGEKSGFVSRGGLKLQRALAAFDLDVKGRACVDVGASTGGFTDVLLRAGASRVYAVDVGFGLLDWRLRSDGRVTVMEKVNARSLTPKMFDPRPSFGATDVSFISLKAVLPPALHVLTGEDRRFVALVKPQFEAKKEDVSPGGVVRDPNIHEAVLWDMLRFVKTLGWAARGLDFSPITGAEGNIEFLLLLKPGDADAPIDPAAVVRAAWRIHGAVAKPSQT